MESACLGNSPNYRPIHQSLIISFQRKHTGFHFVIWMALAFLVLIPYGCNSTDGQEMDGPPGNSFRIQTTVIPQYTSYIELEPRKEYYSYGDTVRVFAWGGGRFSFSDWTQGIPSGATNPYTEFVVRSDTVITASFEPGYLSDRPLLSPRRQIYYADHPRDLYFVIHENRHPLLSIKRDGEALEYVVDDMSKLPETREVPDSRLIKIPAERILAPGYGRHTLDFVFGVPEAQGTQDTEGAQGTDGTTGKQGTPDVTDTHGAPGTPEKPGAPGTLHPTRIVLPVEMDVRQDTPACNPDMKIVSFYVDHGDAVLFFLPDGQTLMMDTGTRQYNERYVVPFLKEHLQPDENGNQRLDHVFITHWHYDHFQGLGSLLEHFEIGSVRYNLAAPPNYYGDYDDFDDPDDPYGFGTDSDGNPTGFRPEHSEDFFVGNQFELGGAEVTILNAARHPDNETWNFIDYVHRNERSLSIRLEYNGFVYSAGGDTYQGAQGAMLSHFDREFLRSHVFHANHHFHGGVSGEYLLATEPILFLTSANAAVYDRDAYVRVLLNEVIPELEQTSSRFEENLLSFETGIAVIRVDSEADWTDPATKLHYETWFLNSLYDYQYKVPGLCWKP